ncbi:hypothetical protein C2R22_20025 [Salinigranum rubrum]|uniref:Uncharacterized protein n=1 Tax=Salinigranum rubrum TaxID=755307 RepID=A0A2I8VNZ2_9EURY|nr:hypothetical protein [Salinigranum rubrum]AUV83650.1 hypothetical protein C2R22_20025 [Salinigranum rubrum]
MSPPSDDHDSDDDGQDVTPDSLAEFDPPTDGDSEREAAPDGTEPRHRSHEPAETTSESLRRTLDELLPDADVDSNWWYWIAAVPAYLVVTLAGGVVAAVLFFSAALLDIVGLGGLASISTFVLFGGFAALLGLLGVVLAFMFPVAVYVDARALEREGGAWTPDPVLWGLLAVVAVLVTNFIVSVPLALYYLYKRHEAVGTP